MKNLLLVVCLLFISCNPLKYLEKDIKKYGYIPLKVPLQKSGLGTIIGGGPKRLKIMAPPNECFPEFYLGKKKILRFVDYTTLPSQVKNITANAKFSTELFQLVGSEDKISLNLEFNRVYSIVLIWKMLVLNTLMLQD